MNKIDKVAEFDYIVRSFFADSDKRLTLPAIFNFLQESAWIHASTFKFGYDDLQSHHVFWALSRVKVCINRLPVWGEEIHLKTWSRGANGLFANRDFEVFDKEGNLVITATSAWLVLDVKTRRPHKLDDFFDSFPLETRRATETDAEKVPVFKGGELSDYLPIQWSNEDVNGHVNNACYVRWAVDAFSPEYYSSHTPKEIDINFLAESNYPQHYATRLLQADGDVWFCSVQRQEDEKELARIKLTF